MYTTEFPYIYLLPCPIASQERLQKIHLLFCKTSLKSKNSLTEYILITTVSCTGSFLMANPQAGLQIFPLIKGST